MRKKVKWIYSKARTDKERIGILKRHLKLYTIMFSITSFIFISFLLFMIYEITLSNKGELILKTEGLSEAERDVVTSFLKDLKPIYTKGHKSISFVKINDSRMEGVQGYNFGGNIVVKYTGNQREMKKTLCHEILHTYTLKGDLTHAVVYDLEEFMPCYKSTKIR